MARRFSTSTRDLASFALPAALSLALAAGLPHLGPVVRAQNGGSGAPVTVDISVDDEQPVLAPDGSPINGYGGMTTLADEHSTIFGPGKLPGPDRGGYLFFVASRTLANPVASGLVVLSSQGPNGAGQWTLDFAPDFGMYSPGAAPGLQNAQIFQSPVFHDFCPPTASGKAKDQDRTFDLNYADPGSVLVDPTNRDNSGPGRLLMIYEGTTRCIGVQNAGPGANNFFATTAVATSNDGGVTWPTYFADAVALPGQSSVGPNAPLGATGNLVCVGSNCQTSPPADYGRYAAVGPPSTIDQLMTTLGEHNLPSNVGDSQPAAFVDDVHGHENGQAPYLYVFSIYNPGDPSLGNPQLQNAQFDLVVSRAQLNAGTSTLQFGPWLNGGFSAPGTALGPGGGNQTPIFATTKGEPAAFGHCSDASQSRLSPSVSYVAAAKIYLLTFTCFSPSDPLSGDAASGGAWFFSTIDATQFDLSSQDQWSAPQEIRGSWRRFATPGNCNADFDGWYPSLMSLGQSPNHLTLNGYVFYLNGCAGAMSNRQYSSRTFTIALR
jgi:hypothetical protein